MNTEAWIALAISALGFLAATARILARFSALEHRLDDHEKQIDELTEHGAGDIATRFDVLREDNTRLYAKLQDLDTFARHQLRQHGAELLKLASDKASRSSIEQLTGLIVARNRADDVRASNGWVSRASGLGN